MLCLPWNDGQASQRRVSALRQTQAKWMLQGTLPHPTPRTGWPLPLRSMLNPKSPENSRAGMRSETAVRRWLTEASAVEGDHRMTVSAGQVNPGAVGLAGLEPGTSSLSVTHGPGGLPRRMKMCSMSGPLGRPLLRGGGERRVDRISDLRACRWRPGIFNPGIEGSALCGVRFPRSPATVRGEGMRSNGPPGSALGQDTAAAGQARGPTRRRQGDGAAGWARQPHQAG